MERQVEQVVTVQKTVEVPQIQERVTRVLKIETIEEIAEESPEDGRVPTDPEDSA